MQAARAGHTASLLDDGKVLVVGAASVSLAELYDPYGVTQAWTYTYTGSVSRELQLHTATVLEPSGKVVVVGGHGDVSAGLFARTILYDEATGLWALSGSMTIPRKAHTATAIPNDGVLVAGGWDGSDAFSTAEIFSFLPLGGICANAGECSSGFCANEVCCDTACDAGACDACSVASGAVSNGTCARFTGIICDDGNSCTQTDTCANGTCVGSDPVTCPAVASDQCHFVGACNVATGVCPEIAFADGTPCDDGDASLCAQHRCAERRVRGRVPSKERVSRPGHVRTRIPGTCSSHAKEDYSPCAGGCCIGGECFQRR